MPIHSLKLIVKDVMMRLGMKFRKHDVNDILKFNPQILEYHFSDSDLKTTLDDNYEQELIVHCYEYFDNKLIDMVNLEPTNQIFSQEKSLELIQKAIDKTVSLGEHFKGKPTIIIHPGGMSTHELDEEKKQAMTNKVLEAVNSLEHNKVNLLLENMPPYAWFYGGRWNFNMFLEAQDLVNYCQESGMKVCFDLCHSQLYCNKNNLSLIDQLEKISPYATHFHLADASGSEGEGMQFGEGDLPFDKVIPILNTYIDKSFAIEVWRGHELHAKGFHFFLDKLLENNMVIERSSHVLV